MTAGRICWWQTIPVPNFFTATRAMEVEDQSYLSGFAVDGEGRSHASMGIAIGDFNRDGRQDLYISAFSDDYNILFRNDGGIGFTDVTAKAGLVRTTIPFLGWGVGFLDFDNDGRLDLFVGKWACVSHCGQFGLGNDLGAASATFSKC